MSKPLSIGVAGLGTVGVGVVKILAERKDFLTAASGRAMKLVAVMV